MLDISMPMCALIEVFSTIEVGFARMGNNACTRKNGPFTLTANERSKPASSHFSTGPEIAYASIDEQYIKPAKLCAHLVSKPFLINDAAGVGLYHENIVAERGLAVSMVSGLVPVTATLSAFQQELRAVSRPMPLVPPVISVRLSFNLFI